MTEFGLILLITLQQESYPYIVLITVLYFLYFPIDNEEKINEKNKITFRDQSPKRTAASMNSIAD